MDCAEKLQRNTQDLIIVTTEDELQFRKKFRDVNLQRRCTVCDATTRNSFHPHPALRVIVCENCLVSYENSTFLSHKDGTDKNCRWCAKLSVRHCCSKCTAVFCEKCLNRNFGDDFVETKIANGEGWSCLFCEPKQLWALRAAYAHAIDTVDVIDPNEWRRDKSLTTEIRKLAQKFLIVAKNDFHSFVDKIQTEIKNFSYIVDENHLMTYTDVERQVCRITAFCGLIVKFITQLNEDQAKNFCSWSEENLGHVSKIDFSLPVPSSLDSLRKNIQSQENIPSEISTVVVKVEPTEVDNHSTTSTVLAPDYETLDRENSPLPCSSNQKLIQSQESISPSEISTVVIKLEPTEDDNHSTTSTVVAPDYETLDRVNSPLPCSSNQKLTRENSSSRQTLTRENSPPRESDICDTSKIKTELKYSPKSKFKLSLIKAPESSVLLSSVSSQDSLERFLDKIHNPVPSTDTCSENITETSQLKELRVSLVDFRKYPQSPLIQSIKQEVPDNMSIFSKMTEHISNASTEPFCDDDLSREVQLTKTLCDKTGDFFDAYVDELPTEQASGEPTSSQETENQYLVPRTWQSVPISETDFLAEEENDKIEQENDTRDTNQNHVGKSEKDSAIESDEKDSSIESDETDSSIENRDNSDSYLDRICALDALQDSDDLTRTNSDASSVSSTSTSSVPSLPSKTKKFKKTKGSKSTPNGYIKTMDIYSEIKKLHQNEPGFTSKTPSPKNKHDLFSNSSPSSESEDGMAVVRGLRNWKKPTRIYSSTDEEDNDANDKTTDDDPKLKQKCEVRILKINFNNCYGLERMGDSDVFKILDKSLNKNDKNEYRRLTTLKPLKNTDDSSDSSDCDKLRKPKKKKHISKSIILSDSESELSSNDNVLDSSFDEAELLVEKNNYNSDAVDILRTTDESDSDITYCSLSNDSDNETPKNVNKRLDKSKDKSVKKYEIPLWRKDKLLASSLNLPNSEPSTSNYNAEEMLEKEEERYLQRIKDKDFFKRKKPKENENETISLSDDSSDEDINRVPRKKRKLLETEEDSEQTQSKIGRKNIRDVLDDSQLQVTTQKAAKEEEKRQERISSKHKLMETMLSSQPSTEEMSEEIGLVLDIDNETKRILVEIPHILTKRLKNHQKEGIKFMWDICCESVKQIQDTGGAGCILAHCMGLGKTLQVVLLTHAILTNPLIKMKRVVVVCPLSIVINWYNEFKEGLAPYPDQIKICAISPHFQKNFKQKVFHVNAWGTDGGVLIISYDTYTTLVTKDRFVKLPEKRYWDVQEALVNPGPDVIICDEGHILKNGKTRKFTALSKITTLRRIVLTGTPLQNNLKEYYHMVNFVKPHLLGTYREFANRFMNPIQNGQWNDSSESDIKLMKNRSHILHKKLETTVHRYGVTELKKYLPIKHDYVLYVKLTELQIALYEKYLQLLDRSTANKTLFNNYHDLQNIWTHPALIQMKFDIKKTTPPAPTHNDGIVDLVDLEIRNNSTGPLADNWFEELMPNDLIDLKYSNKMVILFSILKECVELGDKLLVFSSSMMELNLIERFLSKYPLNGSICMKGQDYFRLDGTIPPEQRTKYCQNFNDPNNTRVRLFLVSHKVGGLGLNLIAANRVVLMDVSWNPSYDIQSVFRIYRFGQKKECYIYRLVSVGTMEELVYTRSVTKLAISGRVVDEHQIQRHFKEDDKHKLYILTKDFPDLPPPKLPSDRLVAKLWQQHGNILYTFCDHQSLLENVREEELNAEERKVAWEEYNYDTTAKSAELNKPKISDTVAHSTLNYSYAFGGMNIPQDDRNMMPSNNHSSRTIPHANISHTYNAIPRYQNSGPYNASTSNMQATPHDNSHRFKKPLTPSNHKPQNASASQNTLNNHMNRALESQLPDVTTSTSILHKTLLSTNTSNYSTSYGASDNIDHLNPYAVAQGGKSNLNHQANGPNWPTQRYMRPPPPAYRPPPTNYSHIPSPSDFPPALNGPPRLNIPSPNTYRPTSTPSRSSHSSIQRATLPIKVAPTSLNFQNLANITNNSIRIPFNNNQINTSFLNAPSTSNTQSVHQNNITPPPIIKPPQNPMPISNISPQLNNTFSGLNSINNRLKKASPSVRPILPRHHPDTTIWIDPQEASTSLAGQMGFSETSLGSATVGPNEL